LKKSKIKNAAKNYLKDSITLQDVFEARSEFWELNGEKQGQWLLHFFTFGQKVKNGKSQLYYIVKNKEVCQKAWIFTHGLSYGR